MALLRFNSKRLAWAAALVFSLLLYASPYLALMQMREAARSRDGVALAAWIDFPSLRASVKLGVQRRLQGLPADGSAEPPSPAQAMGAAVAAAFLGPMVDALITPASLARLLQGIPPARAVLPRPGGSEAEAAPPRVETGSAYEHPQRFTFSIRQTGEDEEPVVLVLHRRGLFGWQLAELRLP